MKILCKYSIEYERFLEQIVDYVLDEYGDKLDISCVEEIELVKQIDDRNESDGRLDRFGTRLVLSERKIKELKCLDISKLEGTDAFNSVISTLYHEFGHATDMVHMPKMYNMVYSAQGKMTPETCAVMLFLEYVASMRIDVLYTGEMNEFCRQVVSGKWNLYGSYSADSAFYYMAKVSVYFIVRTKINNNRKYYLDMADDELFSGFIFELDNAFEKTYQKLPFDSSQHCFQILSVIQKYMPKFEDKYAKDKSFS